MPRKKKARRHGTPIQLWVSGDMAEKLSRLAKRMGRPRTEEIRRALWFYLQRRDDQTVEIPECEPARLSEARPDVPGGGSGADAPLVSPKSDPLYEGKKQGQPPSSPSPGGDQAGPR